MPTARQRANLATDVCEIEGDAEDPTASARLAAMLQRLQALRQAAGAGVPSVAASVANRPAQPGTSTPVAIAAATGADGLFYDKGAATAAGFRPRYWSYASHAAEPAELPAASAAGTTVSKP